MAAYACPEDNTSEEERDEDKEAPAGAETIFADEDFAESRGLRGRDGFSQCHCCVRT